MTNIPEGFPSVTPSIVMDDTAAAIEFYKKALGAEAKCCLSAPDGGVMHAEIQVGSARIMMGQACPEIWQEISKSVWRVPTLFLCLC